MRLVVFGFGCLSVFEGYDDQCDDDGYGLFGGLSNSLRVEHKCMPLLHHCNAEDAQSSVEFNMFE